MRKFLVLIALFFSFSVSAQNPGSTARQSGDIVTLENGHLSIDINLRKVSYTVKDKDAGLTVMKDANIAAGYWNSLEGKSNMSWKQKDVVCNGRKGVRVELEITNDRRIELPEYLFAFTLFDDVSWIQFQCGMKNVAKYGCRLSVFHPFFNGTIFPEQKITDLKTLNGGAGFEVTQVQGAVPRECYNSMLMTAKVNGRRYSMVWGGLKYENFYATSFINPAKGTISLMMSDPTGRLVPVNETYWAPDTYYLGCSASDPFKEAEQYGMELRKANNAHPKVYNFVKQCGWAVGALSHQGPVNNSAALVEQMDYANKSGLTKYTRVAIRLVPDFYCYKDGNTEQGWYDDEHFRKYKHLIEPYETTAKWCAAMKERGGMPFTYFQGNMPSDDFAKAHPEWMLNDDISKLHLYHPHARNEVRCDFTDPGFIAHMKSVWKRLGEDGIEGVFFDYPAGAWVWDAKFEDSLATTTSAYVTMNELAREGLGEQAYLMERNLGGWRKRPYNTPMLDVAAGIVDLQRTTHDNNNFTAEYMSKCGLRWYKSRVVFNYYQDNKEIARLTPEARRTLLTMVNTTSGILELGTSFKLMTPEIVHDISRLYPMYDGLKSPRPIDAFTGVKDPMIYDLELTPDYHVLTLFNALSKDNRISVSLKNDRVDGGLALDPSAKYYAYDFWEDKLVGIFSGSETINKDLKSLSCAVYALRKVEDNPQVISTNRHILQGWMDMKDVAWNDDRNSLSAKSNVVEGEVNRTVVALNGYKTVSVKTTSPGARVSIKKSAAGDNYRVIEISSPRTQMVSWSLKCSK